ncbi:MAG: response regulator [Elusimicrobia bacterium]|nr:response regulator [Candidatus Liberimonas magnetica]
MGTMVLIIEDEQDMANLIRDRLENEGYQTDVAYTGADAIKELREKKPDIVTLDLYLPDINGLNILKELKSNPNTYKIPVIIVSSSEEEDNAIGLGADKFIKKPINFVKLFSVLNDAKTKIARSNKESAVKK